MNDLQLIALPSCDEIPSAVINLYIDAFPAEERREVAMWREVFGDESKPFHIAIVEIEGAFAGFISWWEIGGCRYVEHFAIAPSLRGSGIGRLTMESFARLASTPVVLEVEPAAFSDMAARRIEFYKRCGFTAHDRFKYMQPSYGAGLPSIELMLMSTEPDLDLPTITREIYHQVYNNQSAD